MSDKMAGENSSRILVVDDTITNLQLLTNLLIEQGYTVHPASDGDLALEFVRTTLPDLILLDIQMPGMDGYEVCRRLKADERTCAVPVIFISALEDECDKVRGFRKGAVDYISKPFQSEEVLARIQTHLRLRELTERLEHQVYERTEELETANQLLRQEVIERKKAEELLQEREQALQESEHKYRFLFEESIDGVFLISREGQILDISKTGIRMFGYDSKEEMLSLDLTRDLYLNPEERNEIMRVVEDKALYENETLFKKKNGEKMLARCVISKAEGACDGTTIYQGVIRDVTRQKNLEQELFKAKKLEIIGQLAGGVAHEVRNPLNALLSISEALFLEKDIAENPEYEPYIHHIRTQVGRLSKLMTDLLELGKPIKAKNIHPTSLYKILTDTVNLWTKMDPTRLNQLTFTSDQQTPELLVTVDPSRLQQALLNLLDNASQHSIKNDPISLHVGAPFERRITISIRDAGKGIPPAKLDKVFDPFYTSRTGGTGLGLPLVKHIIESMEGTVKLFNNEPLPGCTAELELMIERRNKERP